MRKPKTFDKWAAAVAIIRELEKLPDEGASLALVPPLFAAVGTCWDDRYTVFQMLDEKPGQFHGYLSWHPLLRQTRNHPTHGPALFRVINGEKP